MKISFALELEVTDPMHSRGILKDNIKTVLESARINSVLSDGVFIADEEGIDSLSVK